MYILDTSVVFPYSINNVSNIMLSFALSWNKLELQSVNCATICVAGIFLLQDKWEQRPNTLEVPKAKLDRFVSSRHQWKVAYMRHLTILLKISQWELLLSSIWDASNRRVDLTYDERFAFKLLSPSIARLRSSKNNWVAHSHYKRYKYKRNLSVIPNFWLVQVLELN